MSLRLNFGTGGFDVRFRLPALSSGQWVAVVCDSAFTADDLEIEDATGTIEIRRMATGFVINLKDTALAMIDGYEFDYPAAQPTNVRVTMRNQAISVVMDEFWPVTLWLRRARHMETPAVSLRASGAITVTDVRLTELADGQDKIWIDIEASSANAIASVIARRPIKQWSLHDGSMCFAYDPPRAVHRFERVWSVAREKALSDRAASDALVYHENTAALVDAAGLELFGMVTRSLRYPEMEQGAIRAARKQMERGRQEYRRFTVRRLLAPALEVYDVVSLEAVIGPAVTVIDDTFVVDSISVDIAGAQAAMTVEGRSEGAGQ